MGYKLGAAAAIALIASVASAIAQAPPGAVNAEAASHALAVFIDQRRV